ncbi:MAG TPA: MaoC family dehydratase [Steroidobacteraceae bacterium]|nr:MaoC family dehydratase [Steroidobacteraceae bacterium]
MNATIEVSAPWFEDFHLGQEFDSPALTLDAGIAATRQAIIGDRLRLPLDHRLARQVTQRDAPLVHPLLAIDVAIGQSTWASQRAKANLFYRSLVLRQPVHQGDTLYTRTRIVGLRRNRPQDGRPATGLVVLEIETRNQSDEVVLHFWRCPMIPCRLAAASANPRDDVHQFGSTSIRADVRAALPAQWRFESLADTWTGRRARELAPGTRVQIEARDTVTSAPELVRLTLNMAMMHVDGAQSYFGRRLVYGGHVLGIAFAQVTRALPNLITLLGWESVEHLAPVTEGDRLRSECTIEEIESCGVVTLVRLAVRTYSSPGHSTEETPVLAWSLWALCL